MKASTQSVVLSALSPVKIDEYEQIKLNKLNKLIHLKKLHRMIVLRVCSTLYFFGELQKVLSNFDRVTLTWCSYCNTSKKKSSLLEYSR